MTPKSTHRDGPSGFARDMPAALTGAGPSPPCGPGRVCLVHLASLPRHHLGTAEGSSTSEPCPLVSTGRDAFSLINPGDGVVEHDCRQCRQTEKIQPDGGKSETRESLLGRMLAFRCPQSPDVFLGEP